MIFQDPSITEIRKMKPATLLDVCFAWMDKEPRWQSNAGRLWDDVKERFCTAPASGSPKFHLCRPGGLAIHSLGVVQNLERFASAMAEDLASFKTESVLLCGLFHDLGKIGLPAKSHYTPGSNGWYSAANEGLSVPAMSLYWLGKYHVELEPAEYQAIMHHDGQYVPEGKWCQFAESRLALLLHYADYWSTMDEKGWPNG